MPAFLAALEPVARVAVATLFNSIWEGAVLAFAVWVILRLLPNLNATTRYAAWCTALAGSLLLPLATALPQIRVAQPITQSSVTAAQPARHAARVTIAPDAAVSVPQHVPAPASTGLRFPGRMNFALPDRLALALFGLWILAAVLLLVRLGVNLLRLETFKRDALPMPVDYRERLLQWTMADKGERDVRLCVCESIEVPVAVGLFDSMILIPRHLLETLTSDEMDQIMLHELGHLRRADDWTNGLQRIVQAFCFFNPAIAYMAQQLDLEREVACDDWVLQQTKSVRPYATCLTKMAEVTAWPHRALAAPGVFVTRRGLSLRVERLLRAGRNIRTSVSLGAAGAVVAALVMMFFVLQSVAPSYAFTTAAAPATVHVAAVPSPSPSPSPTPKPRRAQVREKIIYIDRSPAPHETMLVIPARHIHVPARTIHIPAINVDIKEQHVHVPVPPVTPVLPPNFGATIQHQVQQAMRLASNSLQSGMGGDYEGQNLSAHSFHGQRLTGSDFSRANLQNADFSSTELTGADFSHANLSGANFRGAHMVGCDFSYATINGAVFDGVSATGCDFSNASMQPQQGAGLLRGCHSGCDLSGANLQNADLQGISTTGIDLSHADLRGAVLSGSRFSGVDFSNARMDGARLSGATFVNCSFDGVDKSRADFSGARIVQTHGSTYQP